MTNYYENRSLLYEAEASSLPANVTAEQLGDRVRAELAAQWQVLTTGTSESRKNDALLAFRRWVALLGQARFAGQPDNLPQLALWLCELPTSAKAASGVLVETVKACRAQRPPDEATRRRLAEAARREDALGWGAIVELSVLALPESLPEADKILPQTICKDADVVAAHQRNILSNLAAPAGRASSPPKHAAALRTALRALYLGPGTTHAEPALAELAKASAPDEAWEGVALAALERPRLQRPFLRAIAATPRPSLRPYVEQLATLGSPSIEAEAEALLAALGPAGPAAPGSDQAASADLPRPLPWSPEQRAAVIRLMRAAPGATPETQALGAIQRLYLAKTQGGADLVKEVLAALAPRLDEPAIQALFVEVCVAAPQRQLLVAAAAALLERRLLGVVVPVHLREQLPALAERVVDSVDTSLAVARLGLPAGLDVWSALRKKLVPITAVPEPDLAIALDLAPSSPEVLTRLLAESTPNQRRLLVARAPLARFPRALAPLHAWLAAHDPATLPVLCDRLVEDPPAGAIELLRELASPAWPVGIRQRAVESLGRLGGREQLAFLAALEGVDTRPARKTIIERLAAAGEHVEAGGLELVTALGALALHDGTEPAPPAPPPQRPAPSSPFAAPRPAPLSDPRLGLQPPPRPWNPLFVLLHGLLANNGWGVLWTNALGFVVYASVVEHRPNAWLLLLGVGAFVLNHILADTLLVLRALRHGVLLVATVSVTSTRRRGNNASTTYHHRLTVLDDTGRAHEHVINKDHRLGEIANEDTEPVLALVNAAGKPTGLVPIDTLRLVKVGGSGRFILRPRAIVLLLVLLAPGIVALASR